MHILEKALHRVLTLPTDIRRRALLKAARIIELGVFCSYGHFTVAKRILVPMIYIPLWLWETT